MRAAATLEGFGWPDRTVIEAFGVRVGLRVSDPGLLPRVLAAVAPPGARESQADAPRRHYSVVLSDRRRGTAGGPHAAYADGRPLVRSRSSAAVLDAVAADLRSFVAQAAPRRTFVHAGAVAWRGRGIVLPGASHAGKSELVRALVSAGASYYSDEYAVLDARGWLHPFPKSISLRRGRRGRQVDHPPDRFGEIGRAPVPIAAIVFTRYRRGARLRLCALTRARGALRMLANTLPARRRPAASLRAIARATGSAMVLSGTRGEAEEAAAKLLAQLGRPRAGAGR